MTAPFDADAFVRRVWDERGFGLGRESTFRNEVLYRFTMEQTPPPYWPSVWKAAGKFWDAMQATNHTNRI